MTFLPPQPQRAAASVLAPAPQSSARSDRRRRLLRAADILLIAAWLAIVAGYVEGLHAWISSQFFGKLIFLHPGCFWMSPLALLMLMAAPALVLAAVAWRAERWDVAAFGVTAFSWIVWLDLLTLVPGLQVWAWLIAATGLAAATGRFFEWRRAACLKVARRSVLLLSAPLAMLPVVQNYHLAEREAEHLAALPPAPENSPNVLLIVLDTVRADALEMYGAERAVAPNLARLGEQGIVFDEAWANAPWTLPATASMFTGRPPHELSADWSTPLDGRYSTLAESLSQQGWRTAGFVGNTRYCSRETGLARGFSHYEDYRLSWGDLALCTGLGRATLFGDLALRAGLLDWPGRKRGGEISAGLLNWLDGSEQRDGRPFFAFLNYLDAHDPYVAPEPFRTHRPKNEAERKLLREWWWTSKQPVTEDEIALLRGAYEDCIRGLDQEVGQLLIRLEDRGLLENTIIIVTADHGEHFGEHNLFLHGNSLYEPLLHVPLMVSWPGKIPGGMRVAAPVALNGLPNTVLELAGQAPDFPGPSWVPHWSEGDGSQPAEELIIADLASPPTNPPCHGRSPVCRHGKMRCLRQGDLKYILAGEFAEELYDLSIDPAEETNLIDDPRYAEDAALMRHHCRQTESAAAQALDY